MSVSGEAGRVEVHLGTLCNNRCVFCMSGVDRDHKEPWADLETVKQELRHFRGIGCRSAGFLGGEPSVYPGILEAIAFARDIGYERISLCTNGTRLSDPVFCRALADAGMTRVTLSIHSHRPEIEDGLITLVPGNHARKLAAIENLRVLSSAGRLPDGLALNPVLCRPTLGEVDAYVAFFVARGVRDIRFNFIWPQGTVQHDPAWTPTFAEAMPRILSLILRNEKSPQARLSFGGIPKCALSASGVSPVLLEHLSARYFDEPGFDPDNHVSLATRKGPLQDRFVWQEVKRNKLKVKGPDCAACRQERRCEGVWGTYAQLHGFTGLRPL